MHRQGRTCEQSGLTIRPEEGKIKYDISWTTAGIIVTWSCYTWYSYVYQGWATEPALQPRPPIKPSRLVLELCIKYGALKSFQNERRERYICLGAEASQFLDEIAKVCELSQTWGETRSLQCHKKLKIGLVGYVRMNQNPADVSSKRTNRDMLIKTLTSAQVDIPTGKRGRTMRWGCCDSFHDSKMRAVRGSTFDVFASSQQHQSLLVILVTGDSPVTRLSIPHSAMNLTLWQPQRCPCDFARLYFQRQ